MASGKRIKRIDLDPPINDRGRQLAVPLSDSGTGSGYGVGGSSGSGSGYRSDAGFSGRGGSFGGVNTGGLPLGINMAKKNESQIYNWGIKSPHPWTMQGAALPEVQALSH